MNNKYHQFIRLPKPIINKVIQRLRLAEFYDALDIFRHLSELTHQHTFQSNLGYQGELIGIQRRLNSILKPLGYKLVSKQVPKGIQRAHKVDSKERRWGFEEMTQYEHVQALNCPDSITQLFELDKACRDAERKRKRAERIKAIQENESLRFLMPVSSKENELLNEFLEGVSDIDLNSFK